MFDVIAGTRPTTGPRGLMPLVISLAGHTLVVAAVVIPTLFVMDELPELPSMVAFVAPSIAPPPPPPPPPPAAAAKPAPRTHAVSPGAAPTAIPSRIEPEAAFERVEEGVPGGVEGGIPGGVVGGIVGGISEAPPPAPPPPPPDVRKPVRIGGELSAPALLVRVAPVYPELAQKAHIQGLVILEAAIDKHGAVTTVKVLRSVKFLDEAAVDAVRQWRYSPLLLNGQAVPFVLTVTVSFTVETAGAR